MDILSLLSACHPTTIQQAKLTSRANSIRPDPVWRQSRSQLLHHERCASFALPIRISTRCQSVEAPYATGCNGLASLLHIAFLVPFIEQRQEYHDRVPYSSSVDTKRISIISEIHIPHLPLEILQSCFGRDLGLWSSDTRIGNEDVYVTNF